MPSLRPAPISEIMLETTGLPKLSWIQFFTGLFTGDTGTSFTPVAVGLGAVGTPTFVGAYYRSGQFMDFYIYIVPGTNTTSTSGSTYFDLPFDVTQDGACTASTGVTASAGGVSASANRVFPPSWSNINVPITLSGRVLGR